MAGSLIPAEWVQQAQRVRQQVYCEALTLFQEFDKQDIFDFRLIPDDRFSEIGIAERLGMSRRPVRDVLSRLEREGCLEVHFRSGWSVKPFDFERFEHLYDLRMVLSHRRVAAVRQRRAGWRGRRQRPAGRTQDLLAGAEGGAPDRRQAGRRHGLQRKRYALITLLFL